MPNFRKRPVEIDAVQWDPAAFEVPARRAHTSGVVQWVLDNGGTARWHEAVYSFATEHIDIDTLEGTMRALPGDWIIRGVKGEFYPCKPGIFEQTYVPSTNSERSAALTDLEHVMTLALQAMADNDACADPDDADWRGPAIEQFRSDLRALGVTDAELDAHGLTLDTVLSPPTSPPEHPASPSNDASIGPVTDREAGPTSPPGRVDAAAWEESSANWQALYQSECDRRELADAKLAAVLSECERADDTMRRQYAERNGYGAVPNALEVAALSRLVTAKVRELALEPALSLSVPTSRTCSAGISGGETCALPDGHEGPHSSDVVEVTALTKLDRDAEGGFYGNADTIAVLSPSPTEDEPRYEGWNHAFVPKPRSKRCAQCAHPASHENHGPVSVVSPAASTATPTPIAVMRSIEEYRNAPSNTANAPRYDPAEALYAHVRDEMLAQVRAEDRAFGDALIAWYRDTKHSLLVSDNTVRQTDRELYRLLRPIIENTPRPADA